MSFVYVIASSKLGPVKIGRSADPDARVGQLQTGHSETLALFYKSEVSPDEVAAMERAIHRTIGHKRLRGEWFAISVEDAIAEIVHARIVHEDNLRDETAVERLERFFGLEK